MRQAQECRHAAGPEVGEEAITRERSTEKGTANLV